MLHLLKIEWLKLKSYRTFVVLSALYAISIFATGFIAYRIKVAASEATNNMSDSFIGNPFAFPDVWHTISFLSSFLFFIPGLFIITIMTNEYNFKTHRQNIIDGLSRSSFINVKLVMAVLTAVFATLIVFLTALCLGLLVGSPVSFEKIKYIGYFFIQTLSYTLLALTLTTFIRRSGLALGIFFIYALILENMLSGLLNWQGTKIGNFFPLNVTDALIPFPFAEDIVKEMMKVPPTSYLLIVSAIYLVVYYVVSTRRIKNVDL